MSAKLSTVLSSFAASLRTAFELRGFILIYSELVQVVGSLRNFADAVHFVDQAIGMWNRHRAGHNDNRWLQVIGDKLWAQLRSPNEIVHSL